VVSAINIAGGWTGAPKLVPSESWERDREPRDRVATSFPVAPAPSTRLNSHRVGGSGESSIRILDLSRLVRSEAAFVICSALSARLSLRLFGAYSSRDSDAIDAGFSWSRPRPSRPRGLYGRVIRNGAIRTRNSGSRFSFPRAGMKLVAHLPNYYSPIIFYSRIASHK
jgi:hypothetical protein